MSATDSTSVIPYGVCSSAAGSEAAERLEDPLRHRRTGREDEPERAERLAPAGREAVLGGEHAVERGRRGEDDRRLDRGAGVGQRVGAQRRGLRDVAVGNRDRDAERRPVERERGEGGHEPVVRADRVARAHGLELGRHPPLVVEHALGRPGRARGEDDGRRRVGSRARGARRRRRASSRRPRSAAISSRRAVGAQRSSPRDAERLARAEQPARLGAPQRAGAGRAARGRGRRRRRRRRSPSTRRRRR